MDLALLLGISRTLHKLKVFDILWILFRLPLTN